MGNLNTTLKSISALAACAAVSLCTQAADVLPGLSLGATYDGDLVVNTTGGIKTGTKYVGKATLGLELNTTDLGWYKGGVLHVTGMNTHGGEPTASLVGDTQVFNNNEAGNHTFLFEAWYSQQVGNVTFKAGLQDLNADYAVCETAGNLINSSFGINSVIACNDTPPIFPLTGLGFSMAWNIGEHFVWQTGVFDGNPIDFEDGNGSNVKYDLSGKRWLLITEGTWADSLTNVKLGTFYHTLYENWGIYGSLERKVAEFGSRDLSVFTQLAFSPRKTEQVTANITGGVVLNSVFNKSGKDALSLAATSIAIDGHRWETSVELNYRYQFCDYVYLAPDVQYIINPTGGKNALVTMLRLGLEI